MFNSTFFFGMVCSEPTWVQKGASDELHFMVSAVDKEKDRNRAPDMPYEYVKVPVIITNPNFGDSLMKHKGLRHGSKVTIEGTLTGISGSFGVSGIAVSARSVRVENAPSVVREHSNIKEKDQDLESQPPINPARKTLAYGRTRNE